KAGTYREILNTDSAYYWGSNVGTSDVAAVDSEAVPFHGKNQSVNVTLPPLATIYLKWHS
ncbi:MAG: alpha amylase C-terminal domain-containing protein, partial [Sutterella sp.]|nr:alpha amylase C-terminal domain-containing protein [Sutterella sp.]